MSVFDLDSVDLTNVPDLKAVDPDKEYKVRITQSFTGEDKNGNPYFRFRLEVAGVPDAKDFGYFLGLPSQGMDPKQLDGKRRGLKAFLEAFGKPTSGALDPESLVGAEAWALLGQSDEGEYGIQNYVKRWVLPK